MPRSLPALLLAVFALVAPAQAEDGDYAVGALDRIEVEVAQWSAPERIVQPIDFLSGEALVDATGAVDLPVVGRVEAAGSTLSDLSATIAAGLRDRLGIADELFVSVRVVEFAPVYVVGAVEAPGAFPFRPGLATLQAVALAGGVRRAETLFSRTDRDAVRALGDHRLLEVERWRQLAKVARLEAELADAAAITRPAELDGVAMADELVSVETAIMAARQDEFRSALAAVADLKGVVGARIEKLQQEEAVRRAFLDATRGEWEGTRALLEKGLANNARANDVQETLANVEARVLEVESAILTAEQQLSEAERDENEIRGDRRVLVITELQDARTELARNAVRRETAESLFAEAARFGSTVTSLAENAADRAPTFVVTRGATVFAVDAATPLRAGDVLEVRAPDIAGATVPSLPELPDATN